MLIYVHIKQSCQEDHTHELDCIYINQAAVARAMQDRQQSIDLKKMSQVGANSSVDVNTFVMSWLTELSCLSLGH